MKRFLTLFITLSLILSSFCIPPVSAADDNYSDNSLEVAATLGLMSPALTLDPDAEMTRGDLIETVLKLCNTKPSGGVSNFTDLEETHVHYNAIMTACNMGLVSGFGDGTVRPDDIALVSHAMKLIYYSLGYKEFIEQTNNSVLAVNRADVGMASDTNSTATLTAAKLASLMVEAGESYPLEVRVISGADGGISYEYHNANETALERYYDISKVEGIVTSAGGMNLEPGANYNAEWIVVGDKLLKKDKVSADAFFGQNVAAYYHNSEGISGKSLVCIYPYDNNVVEITPDIYDCYTDGKIYYEVEDNKYKDIDVSFSSVDMFVNNVMVANPNESYFDITSGKITLIDNDMDRVIDVITVVEYETYVVDSVNVSLNTIFGKYNDRALLLDEYDDVNIVSESGEVIYLEEISPNDVLSVVKAADMSRISIVYAITELRGTIQESKEEEGRIYVTIDGKEYAVTDDCKTYEETLLTVGRKGIFPLNAFGEVSTFISIGDIARFGYIIQTKLDSGLDGKIMSKILDENGEVNIYNYNTNVKIDGEVCNSIKAVSNLNGVLVSYTASEDGYIKTVDTPFTTVVTGEGDSKTVTYEGLGSDESYLNSLQMYYDGYETDTKLKYKSSSGILGGKVALDTSAPIFIIPTGNAGSDSDYKAYPIDQYMRGDRDYQLEAYKMTDRSLTADVVVTYETITGSNQEVALDTQPVFVEKTSKVIDAKGDPVTKIVCYEQGSKKEFYLTDELAGEINHTLRGGDIVKLTCNSENYIKGIEVLYSYADREMVGTNPNDESVVAEFRIMNANVYRKEDTMIITTTQNLVPGTDYEGVALEYEEIRNASKYFTMLKYDEKAETITTATTSDIVAFEDTGSICSELFIYDRYGDPFCIFIFND
ncbi:MAG: S-layer homology domain-containing protein [Clostridia bacterium]|nr:S-layer homology domain-containing protein [Clostridia bacterium]